MPNYNSECSKCGHEVEEIRTMAQGIKKKCPECGSRTMKQTFSGKAPAMRTHGYILGHPRQQRGRKIIEPWRK